MKILKIIVFALVAIIAVFLIVAALAPKTFYIERKLVIDATPEAIFNQVNSFQNWEAWSPWIKKDSTIKNVYTGPANGVGNKSAWTSKKSGVGSQEITESVPSKTIRTKLILGSMSPADVHFYFNPVDGGTEVVWSDSATVPYPWNIFTLVADKMLGGDFAAGLQNLKAYVESQPQWKLGEYKIEELAPQHILSIVDSCEPTEISSKLGALYGEIGAVMKKNKMTQGGPVMAFYHSYVPDKQVVLEAAVPVAKEIKGEGRVKGKTTPKTKVLAVSFFGDYTNIAQAYSTIMDYMKTNKLESNGPELEVYVTDPTTVKNKWEIETRINLPVK